MQPMEVRPGSATQLLDEMVEYGLVACYEDVYGNGEMFRIEFPADEGQPTLFINLPASHVLAFVWGMDYAHRATLRAVT